MTAAAMKARPFKGDPARQQRNSMIAKIMVAKKELAMSEDDYRAILLEETGETSLKQCDRHQMERVVKRLKTLGFTPVPRKGAKGTAQHPVAKKARALWISLYHLNVVQNPSEQTLEVFAKRQLKCDKLVWARQSHGHKLIEALKDMAKRAGWHQVDQRTGKQLSPITLNSHLCQVILGKLKAADAVPQDWHLGTAAWRLCGIETVKDQPFSAEDYQALAKALGDKLRALVPQGDMA